MRNKIPRLCIIVPCYNEEEVIPIMAPLFLEKIYQLENNNKIAENSRILFVNDGSSDNTWNVIKSLSDKNRKFFGISQSRNRGHQKALFAGFMEVKESYDITVSIDCDGQDDINAIDSMINCYSDGCEIVYGVRKNRLTDSFFKRLAAETFYKLLIFMKVEIIHNHADYRLVSCKVLKELEKYGEVTLFLRGMFPLVGFKSTAIYYDRSNRIAGKSKYSLSKMLSFALDGITGLTVKPVHFVLISGIFMLLLSILCLACLAWEYFSRKTVSYHLSSLTLFLLLGGIQLTSIGIIGEYIGKIYTEVKKRPTYIINERTDTDNGESEEKINLKGHEEM